jgi:hypothetical protein
LVGGDSCILTGQPRKSSKQSGNFALSLGHFAGGEDEGNKKGRTLLRPLSTQPNENYGLPTQSIYQNSLFTHVTNTGDGTVWPYIPCKPMTITHSKKSIAGLRETRPGYVDAGLGPQDTSLLELAGYLLKESARHFRQAVRYFYGSVQLSVSFLKARGMHRLRCGLGFVAAKCGLRRIS